MVKVDNTTALRKASGGAKTKTTEIGQPFRRSPWRTVPLQRSTERRLLMTRGTPLVLSGIGDWNCAHLGNPHL